MEILIAQNRPSPLARLCVALTGAGLAIPCLFAAAQSNPGSQSKETQFEVLSIRPMISSVSVPMNTNPSPNGFESRLSLWQAIMVAYGPVNYVNWGSVEILKAPSWIGDFYDIKARVSQADLKAWQTQTNQHELLRSAVRAALKERCKLAIHEQPSKAEIFELVVGKRGPRLKAAVPGSMPHTDVKLPSGGVLVQTVENGKQVKSYYGATAQDLADFLSIMSGRIPVRDRTGLTGRYDFTIQQTPPLPDENHVYSYPVDHLGLQVKAGSESRPMLVIDHIEKPTPN
ncbi:MAG TPA: TIGR03435 family protein [Bryobacteraceae bacterium]|nr:TIGR03435 family protein [Bryobacteraceae bacterium]